MTTAKNQSTLQTDVYFLLSSAFILMILQTVLRLILLARNHELATQVPMTDLCASFLIGMRFDLIITVYAVTPLVLGMLFRQGFKFRKLYLVWLTFVASLLIFLAVMELDFYHEFHTRLNSLVFEYLKEEPGTVLSMVWYGFPVIKYLMLVVVLVTIIYYALKKNSDHIAHGQRQISYSTRLCVFFLLLIVSIVAARGTLRQGPPLRWGDAFHSEYLFSNHLALNGVYTLSKAIIGSRKVDNKWLKQMPLDEANSIVKTMLLTSKDKLLSSDTSPTYRQYDAGEGLQSEPLNVVFILMESFSGEYVGALGHDYSITPEFDKLSQKGLLFERFFSNGTHTHQGMFASVSCFPNLPHYEYLMQQPEGTRKFSGSIQITADRGYQSLYVYNGDFAWDNQKGFFGTQGMQRFIGRHDYVNPIFSDPTWGVSDQDMFNRAEIELKELPKDKPFFAFLQTLSNHTPYALPIPLPVRPVTGFGSLDEHLTAMRYSDWALGQFFKKVEQSSYYKNTIFVIVGDHGFGTNRQLTDIDLLRFHVPLLIIGPGIIEKYGRRNTMVGSQVDIAPIIAGLLGGKNVHSCWGRDLLNIDDKGFAIIKPSGSDPTTAIISGEEILVRDAYDKEKLYSYQLGKLPEVTLSSSDDKNVMSHRLSAYIQSATKSLLDASTHRPDFLTKKDISNKYDKPQK